MTRDPNLAELCEAYETAWTATEYWSQSTAEFAPARAAEYRDIALAMEHDILARLQ